MSGLTPADISTAFLYDHFTPFVLMQLEELGFCGRGEAKDFATVERLSLGGELPINTSGGLLGEAYIHGMNGITEVVAPDPRHVVQPGRDVEHVLVTAGTGVPTSGLILSQDHERDSTEVAPDEGDANSRTASSTSAMCRCPSRRPTRRACASARRACVTPICTSRVVTGWDCRTDGTLGHEAIGVVEALGPGAERYVSVGDRVILGLGGMGGGYWCGACEYCLSGRPRLCAQARPVMGTFAEQMCVWAPALVKIPDELGDEEAPARVRRPHRVQRGSQARDAPHSTGTHDRDHRRGRRARALRGADRATRSATASSGVDVGEERLEFVRSLGAEHAVSADDAAGLAFGLGGVDAVLVFAARLAGFELGFQMLRRGGLFVAVGIPPSSDGQPPAATVAALPHRPDDHLLRGRHGAGDARARRARGRGQGQDARVACRRARRTFRRSSTSSTRASTSAAR